MRARGSHRDDKESGGRPQPSAKALAVRWLARRDLSRSELTQRLQRRGVESRLVVFPNENHWVLKPANSLQWHNEVFGWLDKYLKPAP